MTLEKQSSETKHLTGTQILDLETNGLLKNTTEIHCIAVHYIDEGITVSYNDTGAADPIVRGVQFIEQAERIIGHNIIGFDLPIIKKYIHGLTLKVKSLIHLYYLVYIILI